MQTELLTLIFEEAKSSVSQKTILSVWGLCTVQSFQ